MACCRMSQSTDSIAVLKEFVSFRLVKARIGEGMLSNITVSLVYK